MGPSLACTALGERERRVEQSAMLTNTNHSGVLLEGEPGMAGEEVAHSSSAQPMGLSGDFKLGWNLWGYSGEVPVGDNCIAGTNRVAAIAYSNDPANVSCSIADWVSKDQFDCRAIVRYSVAGGKTGTCFWEIQTEGDWLPPRTCLDTGCPSGRVCCDCTLTFCTTPTHCRALCRL